jgi:hypothetical protein
MDHIVARAERLRYAVAIATFAAHCLEVNDAGARSLAPGPC